MWKHFVALGDSFTEGIGDTVEGAELKSWVDRFAHLHTPELQYTNLAKRGLVTHEVRLKQLEQALALQPDLVSLIAGANDILKGRWNRDEYKTDMELMINRLHKSGADIIIANLPDFTVRLPLPVEQQHVVKAQLIEANEIIQSLSNEYKLYHIDCWNHPMAKDNTLWSKDLIHPNSRGYRVIAETIFNHVSVT
ncbi:SGNH/GDSL hydrolase family protein [Paenibacillus macquariensis]|uniref:Lysophospholipase L1 n=1 Tax=Paenibacillus macquariensis TaxID=948756 RepID=A0ABY1KBX9_9BACL|nr:SGNH/GDSL hydrolase family protein [Paenibacillus macquariensis]MEC0093493.1 SGNH/GDSL hydrolase family protein [Paenibacillus macquariensis]OAB29893.1 lipase [Paenibacillus macquariensis subsp. macquariensis]SIR57289.1 Lysophospholipase L1 [Paenibacillus macquariensis]